MSNNLERVNEEKLKEMVSAMGDNELHALLKSIPSEMLIDELKERVNFLETKYNSIIKLLSYCEDDLK